MQGEKEAQERTQSQNPLFLGGNFINHFDRSLQWLRRGMVPEKLGVCPRL